MSSKKDYLQKYLGGSGGADESDGEYSSKPAYGATSDYKDSKKRKHKDKKKKKHKHKKSKEKSKKSNVVIQDEDNLDWQKKKAGTIGSLGLNPFEEGDAPVLVDLGGSHKSRSRSRSRSVDSDMSVPRNGRRIRHDSSSENDNGSDSDVSVPRKRRALRHDSSDDNESDADSDDSDMAVPRRRPTTEKKEPGSVQVISINKVKTEEDTGGIKDKETFARELAEKKRLKEIGDTEEQAAAMGKNANTVYRDKRGRKLDMLNEFMKSRDLADGKAVLENKLEYEWGTGKVDKDKAEERRRELEEAKDAPFARYADDERLNERLKSRIRSGDPMAGLVSARQPRSVSSKSSKPSKNKGLSAPTKPIYKGPPPAPNRFGIKPGYRWDGIDRGSGFERKFLEKQNSKMADREERYKWSVEDM